MSCGAKYIITKTEPKAQFWSKYGCAHTYMELNPGLYKDLDDKSYNGGYFPIRRNGIDAIRVPPNMKVWASSKPNFETSGAGVVTFNPGLYSDLDNPYLGIGRNGIDSMRVIRTKPWDQHLVDCCKANTANNVSPESCGIYWGKGTSGACDALIENHCKSNKDDEACGCYADAPGIDDPITQRLIKANPLCYSRSCNMGISYVPTPMRDKQCPDITICKQDITVDGAANQLYDNLLVQDCAKENSPKTETPEPIPAPDPIDIDDLMKQIEDKLKSEAPTPEPETTTSSTPTQTDQIKSAITDQVPQDIKDKYGLTDDHIIIIFVLLVVICLALLYSAFSSPSQPYYIPPYYM